MSAEQLGRRCLLVITEQTGGESRDSPCRRRQLACSTPYFVKEQQLARSFACLCEVSNIKQQSHVAAWLQLQRGKRWVITQRTFLYKLQTCPSWKLLHEDVRSPDSHKQCSHTLTLLLVTLGRRVPLIAGGHMDQRVPTVQFGNHGCNVPLFVSCYISLWFTGESQIRNRLPFRETYCEWRPRVFGHPQIALPLSSRSDLDFFSPDYCYVSMWVVQCTVIKYHIT